LFVNLPNPHLEASTRPYTPEVMRAKEHTSTPSPFVVFTFGLAVESIKELGVHQVMSKHAKNACVLVV
jgi:hypothetical protein